MCRTKCHLLNQLGNYSMVEPYTLYSLLKFQDIRGLRGIDQVLYLQNLNCSRFKALLSNLSNRPCRFNISPVFFNQHTCVLECQTLQSKLIKLISKIPLVCDNYIFINTWYLQVQRKCLLLLWDENLIIRKCSNTFCFCSQVSCCGCHYILRSYRAFVLSKYIVV